MQIVDQNSVIQALANVTLESLTPSDAVQKMVEQALQGAQIDTTVILEMLRTTIDTNAKKKPCQS